jgi:hypothetical protein
MIPQRDPIAAAMRATGKTRLQVLEGILEGFERHPDLMTTDNAKMAKAALLAAIEKEKEK